MLTEIEKIKNSQFYGKRGILLPLQILKNTMFYCNFNMYFFEKSSILFREEILDERKS